jgi:putative methionine-R-sulfoxide reductase with GAF domain
MAEDLNILQSSDKAAQYQSLLPQIEALLQGETDLTANLANMAAALKEQFKWFWVGFYLVKNGELVLGPFQGPVACTRIGLGKGVWCSLGAAKDADRSGCGSISGAYCLQLAVAIRNCGAFVP